MTSLVGGGMNVARAGERTALAVGIVLGMAVAWLTGCAAQPHVVYRIVAPVTISVESDEMIRDGWRDVGFAVHGRVAGYCEQDRRIIHVPWATDWMGRPLGHPDFWILGHEAWHLWELGGSYHY